MNTPLPERWTSIVLGLFRIVTALLFVCHGASSLFGILNPYQQPAFLAWPGWWAALIQFAGGILVGLGGLTRPAALLCSGSMAYAYFTVHQEHALWPIQNGGEAPVMFCWAFLVIAAVGPGAAALDALLLRRSATTAAESAAPAGSGREPAALSD
ncbi:DoxX family protein [Streptomyces sp. NPDC092296]|uniref:DoxX family protein n=1 Tax=Streptomyces sp. NPDC092296 TaxID=3366012 RepID=UPI00382F083B